MITSKTNTRIKEIRLLRQGKHRQSRGEYFVEGIKLLEEVLRQSLSVRRIAYSPRLEKSARGVELLSRARKTLPRAEWLYVGDEVMDSVSDAQSHQGVLTVLEKRENSWADLLARNGIIVLLNGLQDPGNVGTILRTADAGGAAGVVLSPDSADPYSPKAVRAAMGSLFRIPVLIDQGIGESLRILRREKIRIYAAATRGEKSLWDTELSTRGAVLFGGEGGGLPDSLISMCDTTITVPMKPDVDSLNVAIAAGLIIYEALRQKHNHRGHRAA